MIGSDPQGLFITTKEVEEVIFRPMGSEDLQEVLALEAVSSLTPWSKQMFLDELDHPLAFCYVVEEQKLGRPLSGYICFRIIGEESEILNLCVAPSRRRQGLGRRLMEFYLNRCELKRVERSYLEVLSSNDEALRLYRSFSYEIVGKRSKFYQGRFDALLMMKRL